MFDVIRKVLEECGYCTDGIEMDTFVHQQSPDTVSYTHLDVYKRQEQLLFKSGPEVRGKESTVPKD